MYSFLLSNSGLIVGTLGSFLVAISFGGFPKGFGGSTTSDDGKKYHFAYVVHPILFKIGLWLIPVGFILQLRFIS